MRMNFDNIVVMPEHWSCNNIWISRGIIASIRLIGRENSGFILECLAHRVAAPWGRRGQHRHGSMSAAVARSRLCGSQRWAWAAASGGSEGWRAARHVIEALETLRKDS